MAKPHGVVVFRGFVLSVFQRVLSLTACVLFFHADPALCTVITRGGIAIPSAPIEVPLFARSGTHHLKLLVGEPPVPQILIIDTGSHLSSWRCFERRDQESYEPRRSATALEILCENGCHFVDDSTCGTLPDQQKEAHSPKVGCMMHQHYTEGSGWQAYELNDLVSLSVTRDEDTGWLDDLSLSTTIPFTFGCQTSVSGLFRKQFAHGILGLGRANPRSLPRQLHRHQVTESSAFSLCFTESGGTLGIGGALTRLHDEPMELTEIVVQATNKTSNLYTVQVAEVWLGDTCLTNHVRNPAILDSFAAGRGTIIDSGTTDTYFPATLQHVLEEAWTEQTGRNFARRGFYTRSEFNTLPDLHIVFQGNVTLAIKPRQYMDGSRAFENKLRRQDDKFLLYPSIYQTEKNGAVLGSNAMIGYDVLFDSDIVGFAPVSSCGE